MHNNSPASAPSIVSPIVAALAEAWDGPVLAAHAREVVVTVSDRVRTTVRSVPVTPTRVYARTFSSPYADITAEALAHAGARVLNAPDAVRIANSKFLTATTISAAGLPVPEQLLVSASRYDGEDPPCTAHLGWPQVVKNDCGFGGHQVHLVTGAEQLNGTLEAAGHGVAHVAQRFVAESAGVDLRVLVAGGEVVASGMRASRTGDFRANLHQGAVMVPVEIAETEARMAVACAAAVGLTVAGVDLVRSVHGPLMLEVNANPGLRPMADFAGPAVYQRVAEAIVSA